MCGIFGYFSASNKISAVQIRISLKALHHRGPDNSGVVCSDSPNSEFIIQNSKTLPDGRWSSLLAHTRLSIIDLSEAANQPMCNEDGSVWVVYNGEIYNFNEIREDLTARGHSFKSRTDSEVIVHGYEEWGIDVVQRFRGMFAFALFDQRKKKLILVRDRLGVKPLKYYFKGDTFIFASEIKSLMHLIPGKLDFDSLNRYLTLKYIPSPKTILEGVKKLSPSEILEFDINSGRVKTQSFWKPEFYPKSGLPFSEAKENFERLLTESVHMRTISDVPIGVYLSGGMDSSAIVAFMRKSGVDNINTFTIKFDRPGYDESGFARTVAERFKTRHHEFQIPELTFNGLENIINSLDEPFGDPSYIPTYFLSSFASKHVKVILSGDGGDEILGGYKRYFIYSRGKALGFLPRINSYFIKNLPPEINKKSFIGKIQRLNEELSMGYWGAYLLRFNGLSDSFKRYVMVRERYDSLHRFSIDDIILNFGESDKITNTIERLIWIDMHTYLPDYILTKTDLALMAHSIEGRNPLVDYRLVEFANRLEPQYKFRGGGKYILKSILEEYIPKEIIYRKKMGFSPPIKYWFRANIGLLHQIFSERDFVSGDIFDLKRIHQVIEKFKTPEINISEQLWLIMVLELWRRKYRV
jgi:asparagine synthase (glutamine-hydrolysing)